jgi:hypothetical protein
MLIGKILTGHLINLEDFTFSVTKKGYFIVQLQTVIMTVLPVKEAVESTSKQSIRDIYISTRSPKFPLNVTKNERFIRQEANQRWRVALQIPN